MPPPGQPGPPTDPNRDGPRRALVPDDDVPPIRRLFQLLRLLAVLCAILALVLWWQILR